jgi:cysteine desulfurase / selenocysteine lyase
MTTPTPTSKDVPEAAGAAGAPPAGWPDQGTLARLAGEFFAALPGSASLGLPLSGYIPQAVPPSSPAAAATQTGDGARPSVSTSASGPPRVPYSETLSTPQAVGTGVPHVGATPPDPPATPPTEPQPPQGYEPGLTSGLAAAQGPQPKPPSSPLGAAAQAAPPPSAPSLPAAGESAGGPRVPYSEQISRPAEFATEIPALGPPSGPQPPLDPPATPVSVPSTPYYFIGESSGYPAATRQMSAGQEDPILPQSYGLPGQFDVQQLLKEIVANDRSSASEASVPKGGAPAGQYYFLDRGAAPPSPQGAPASDVPQVPASAHPAFDVNAVRRDFPILSERVNGRRLVWLDNAATTQKPQAVIDRLAHFYAHENSNIHRAAHELAARSTDAYEGARSKVARFLGASSAEEIIFVRGATEAINLVAQSWGKQNLRAGDEILLSWLEHHANIVPWQQIAAETGARIRVAPVDDDGQVLLHEYQKLLSDRTKIAAFTQVSNALGTIAPVQEMTELAHRAGAKVLIDGAQAVSHMRVNVQALDADFYVFSGHKLFAPTGIGVVYGKSALLNAMPPYQGGGNMIQDVTFEKTTYQKAPQRFEAGTGNIADAVGLGAAIDYLERLGMENIGRYEHGLLVYATEGLKTVPGLRLIGTAKEKASVLSFVLQGYRPEDVGTALNREGIAVRAGHHCAQPILRRFGLEATVRPSLAFYNTCEEVDQLVAALQRLARASR